MQRWALKRCIVQKSVVYAKKADTPFGVSAFLLPLTRTDGALFTFSLHFSFCL